MPESKKYRGISDRELLVRIDERLNNAIEIKKDHEERVRKLERKWYTSISALGLAVGSWIKQLIDGL